MREMPSRKRSNADMSSYGELATPPNRKPQASRNKWASRGANRAASGTALISASKKSGSRKLSGAWFTHLAVDLIRLLTIFREFLT